MCATNKSLITDEPKKTKKKSDSVFGITPTEEQKPIETLLAETEVSPPKNEPTESKPTEDPPPIESPKPEEVSNPTEEPPVADQPEEQEDDIISPDDDVVTEVPVEKTNGHVTADVLQIESEEETEENTDDVVEPSKIEEPEEPTPEPIKEPTPEPVQEPEPTEPADSGGGVTDSQEIGVIEGVVNGEDEVESFNNDENSSTTEDRTEVKESTEGNITEMVEAGNMEQLAAIVLNGEGDKLIGQTSENPEIQAFLDNVPIYMVRICIL